MSKINKSLIILWTIILIVCSYLLITSYQAFVNTEDLLKKQASSYAHLIAAHDRFSILTAQNLIDEVMDHLTYEDVNKDVSEERRKEIKDSLILHRSRLNGIASFTVIDEKGIRKFGVVNKDFTDLSKREYFMKLKEGENDTFVSGAEEGLASGKTGLHIAKKFKTPEHSFAGVVVINLSVNDVFYPFYSSLNLGSQASIAIREKNKILSRFPDNGGKPSSVTNGVITEAIARGDVRCVFRLISVFDGVERVNAFEKLENLNIYAVAGLSVKEVMEEPKNSLYSAIIAIILSISAAIITTITLKNNEKNRLELAESLITIKHMAHHDALTKLPNRIYSIETFHSWAKEIDEKGGALALIYTDLDNFKTINDTLGHAAGDSLLIQVTQKLSKSVNIGDIVSRHGGDEFVIIHKIQKETDPKVSAEHLCWRILDSFKTPFNLDGQSVASGASLGVALYPHHGVNFEEVARKADTAMYYSKASGRGTYTVYEHSMEEVDAKDNLSLHSGMLSALKHNEFELYYQPFIDIKTQKISGVEALLRWNRPGHEVVPAAKFIQIAEKNGLIVHLGEFVIDKSCEHIAQWKELGICNLPVSINLSAVQFRQSNLETTIERAVSNHNLEPSCLNLELTETVLISEHQIVIEKIKNLQRKGFSFSLDDFGTGYSSLSYLRKFPINCIKLDKSFITELSDINDDNSLLVSAIVNMSKVLKMTTIAEGVENIEAYNIIKELGCDKVQGYYFAMPMPEKEFIEYYKNFDFKKYVN